MKVFQPRKSDRGAGHKNSSQGFTIVELMVALSVLSVILVTSTVILIQIGVLYSKGVNGANLQTTTRNITADVSSSLQFSDNPPTCVTLTTQTCYSSSITFPGFPVPVYAFCIGATRYSYVLDHELGNDSNGVSTPHVLWRDNLATSGSACAPLNINNTNPGGSNGYEMIGNHMRLLHFKVNPTSSASNIYNVEVWTAFGDSDLVNTSNPIPTCNGGAGTQFCAVSEITTAVTGRIY